MNQIIKHSLLLSGLLFILVGCKTTQSAIPAGYQGQTATVIDTYTARGRSKVDFFYLSQVDKRKINTAISHTAARNSGQGSQVTPYPLSREIPAEPLKLKIAAQRYFAAPILLLTNEPYLIEGEFTFTPVAGEKYSVKGVIHDKESQVWLVDSDNNIVSPVIKGNLKQKIAATYHQVNQQVADLLKQFKQAEIHELLLSKKSQQALISLLGAPNTQKTETRVITWPEKEQVSILSYVGLGEILINAETKQIKGVNLPHYIFDTSKSRLQSKDAYVVKSEIRNMYSLGITETTKLDEVAKIIWAKRDSQNDEMIDAISWGCRLLGQSQKARYRQMLKAIINETSNKKLKKYAKGAVEQLVEASEADSFSVQ